jgi:outer membrane protein assembly factor BamB
MTKPTYLAFLILWLTGLGADWPQFLGPNRDGVSTEAGILTSWPRQGPPLVWQRDVGPGLAGPVVVGERLILFHRVGDREVVACLGATTGKEQWQFAYETAYQDDLGVPNDPGPRSTPTVIGNRVYTLGAEGRLHCLDLATGRKLWGRALNEEYGVRKGFFGVTTSPLVLEDRAFVNVGGQNAGIVALDAATGKEVWKATDHEASNASPVAATFGGEKSILFLTREGFVALNPADGAVRHNRRWRARINASVNAATPVVAGDLVFVSASYNTGALVLRGGRDGFTEVWKGDDVMSNHFNTCVHRDGHLYGIDGRQEEGARLRCVDLKTGKVCWTQEGFGCATLVAVGGNVIALTENGDLVMFEATPKVYQEKARANVLTNPCRAQHALANGRLYARDVRRLACWNVKQ